MPLQLRFVAGLATVEQLREREGPQVVAAAEACGGNGCGSEYAVLVFGGALELRHAIQILKVGLRQLGVMFWGSEVRTEGRVGVAVRGKGGKGRSSSRPARCSIKT